jgi:hypothetical protein
MTRPLEAYAEDTSGGTTTSTSATNSPLSTAHTGEASTQYMIFCHVKVNKNEITTDLNVRLHNATAGATYETATLEIKDATDQIHLTLLGDYTAAGSPVANTIELRIWCETSGTIAWDEAVIYLIKKHANDSIGSSTGDSTTALTPVDKISISHSVGSDGRFTIWYSLEARTADTDLPPLTSRIDIDGSDQPGTIRNLKGQDVTSRYALHACFPVTLTAGTRDIDLEVVSAGGSLDNGVYSAARCFVIDMSTFDNGYDVFASGRDANVVNDTYEDVPSATLTQSLQPVDHVVWGSLAMDCNITTQSYLGKFQQSVGGSNSDRFTWNQEPYASTDLMPMSFGYKLPATAVEHIWKYQHAPESTADIGTTGAAIIVGQVAASAAGQPAVKRMGGVHFAHRMGSGVW